jgi:transposase InsO family protein
LTIEKMGRLQTAIGLPYINPNSTNYQCENCPFGKITRKPFKLTEELPTNIGDLISSDVCGPFEASVGGFKYFVTWIDHKSKYVCIDFTKNKECTTITNSFLMYMVWLKKQKRAEVKRIRMDNGGEYIGKEFEDLCSKHGIIHEKTTPYTPEHNAVAE